MKTMNRLPNIWTPSWRAFLLSSLACLSSSCMWLDYFSKRKNAEVPQQLVGVSDSNPSPFAKGLFDKDCIRGNWTSDLLKVRIATLRFIDAWPNRAVESQIHPLQIEGVGKVVAGNVQIPGIDSTRISIGGSSQLQAVLKELYSSKEDASAAAQEIFAQQEAGKSSAEVSKWEISKKEVIGDSGIFLCGTPDDSGVWDATDPHVKQNASLTGALLWGSAFESFLPLVKGQLKAIGASRSDLTAVGWRAFFERSFDYSARVKDSTGERTLRETFRRADGVAFRRVFDLKARSDDSFDFSAFRDLEIWSPSAGGAARAFSGGAYFLNPFIIFHEFGHLLFSDLVARALYESVTSLQFPGSPSTPTPIPQPNALLAAEWLRRARFVTTAFEETLADFTGAALTGSWSGLQQFCGWGDRDPRVERFSAGRTFAKSKILPEVLGGLREMAGDMTGWNLQRDHSPIIVETSSGCAPESDMTAYDWRSAYSLSSVLSRWLFLAFKEAAGIEYTQAPQEKRLKFIVEVNGVLAELWDDYYAALGWWYRHGASAHPEMLFTDQKMVTGFGKVGVENTVLSLANALSFGGKISSPFVTRMPQRELNALTHRICRLAEEKGLVSSGRCQTD